MSQDAKDAIEAAAAARQITLRLPRPNEGEQ